MGGFATKEKRQTDTPPPRHSAYDSARRLHIDVNLHKTLAARIEKHNKALDLALNNLDSISAEMDTPPEINGETDYMLSADRAAANRDALSLVLRELAVQIASEAIDLLDTGAELIAKDVETAAKSVAAAEKKARKILTDLGCSESAGVVRWLVATCGTSVRPSPSGNSISRCATARWFGRLAMRPIDSRSD